MQLNPKPGVRFEGLGGERRYRGFVKSGSKVSSNIPQIQTDK